MRDRLNHEAIFLEHLGWIDRVAARACRKYGLMSDEAEDFASFARMKILENDYAALRNFRGETEIKTFLAIVVVRYFHAYIRERWGRWRPSPVAVSAGAVRATRDAARVKEPIAHTATETQPRAVMAVIDRAIKQLDPEEQFIVRMHIAGRRSLDSVARALRVDEEPLHDRIPRLRDRLRTQMEQAGIAHAFVRSILDADDPLPGATLETDNGWPDHLEAQAAKVLIAELMGGLLSWPRVAEILRINVFSIDRLLEAHALLFVQLPDNRLVFPALQFDRGHIRSGVAEVAAAGAHINSWVLLSILVDDVEDARGGILLERLDEPAVLTDVLNRLATYGSHGAA